MVIIKEDGYYYIAKQIKKLYGWETRHDLGKMLKMSQKEIEEVFKKKYNATYDNPYNNAFPDAEPILISFKNLCDAERALEWINSIELVNKLGVE